MSGEDIDLNALDTFAGETAMALLDDAREWMLSFCDIHDLPRSPAGDAYLMVGFATLKQRERHYEETRMSRQRDIAVRDYDFLKWLIEKASPNLSEAEAAEARARIIEIAGV